jgi:pimeloyl-ACP methyl ester carboxylesterase
VARFATHPGLHDAGGETLAKRMLDIGGVETHVVEAGSGPPVLLLHGFADTCDGWRRIVPRLLAHHRVIAIDIPPFGRSHMPVLRDGQTLIDFYGEYFPRLFEELEVEQAAVMGHSLGGAVALSIALEQPQSVSHLCLIAPAGLGVRAPWWWQALAGRPVNWMALLKLPNPIAAQAIRTAMRGFLEERLMFDNRGLDHAIEYFVDLYGGRRELERLLSAGRALIPGYTGDLLQRSRHLARPVTVIWGRHDRLAPVEHAASFAAAVPQSRVHLLEGCGHYPQIELPAQVNEILEGALEEIRAAKVISLRRRAAGPAPAARRPGAPLPR